jgi:cell division protein FtsB
MKNSGLNADHFKWLKFLAIFFAVIIAGMVIYFPDYAKLKHLREENKKLRVENRKVKKEIEEYERKIRSLGKDPYIYEKIARDNLGVAKEGEIVIDIKE